MFIFDAEVLLSEFLDCNVLDQAKYMRFSEVYDQAQRRLNRLGPLRKLTEP